MLDGGSGIGMFNVSRCEGHTFMDLFRAFATYLGIDPPAVYIVPPGQYYVQQLALHLSATEQDFDWNAKVKFAKTIIINFDSPSLTDQRYL